MSPRLLSILTLGAACALAPAQSATVHLTNDDADGWVNAGDVVIWTLSVGFEGFPEGAAAQSGNMRLVAKDPGLLGSSELTYTPTNGGNNGGEPDGAGGISFINWTNTDLLSDFYWLPPTDRSNPFVVGTFTTTALRRGVLGYHLELGEAPSAFLTIEATPFIWQQFSRDEVAFLVNGFPDEPFIPDDPFDPSGSPEACSFFDFTDTGFGLGVNDAVRDLLVLPDGDLIVAGDFTQAGGQPASGIARWDGESWHALADGIDGSVLTLALMPNGDLVAGGRFNPDSALGDSNVARWDGQSWTSIGTGIHQRVNALAVLPDGRLVAAGAFNTFLSSTVNRVAVWDGIRWATLGGGTDGAVRDLLVLPKGDLVAAGQFSLAGQTPVANIARWDGASWHPLGAGLPLPVNTLALGPEGELIAGGSFGTGPGVARWDGLSWSPIGEGAPGFVNDFLLLPGGDLVAGGGGVARWDGESWFTVGSRIGATALEIAPDGTLLLGNLDGLRRLDEIPLAPRLIRHPEPALTCPIGGARFRVFSDGPGALSYQWEYSIPGSPEGWTPAVDGTVPGLATFNGSTAYSLRVSGATRDLELRCVVSNPCMRTTSEPADLLVAASGCCDRLDFTQDGVLDNDDVSAYIQLFLAGSSGANLNADPILDLDDLQVFVYLYLSGCG